MEETPHDAALGGARSPHERHQDIEVQVRRSPKYGRFMAVGAVVGAVALWVAALVMPPPVDDAGAPVDTTAVVGLVIVIGFVVGAGLGGLVAVVVDRRLAKRGATLVAEQTDVEVPEAPAASQVPSAPEGPAASHEPAARSVVDPGDAAEPTAAAAFEPLDELPGAARHRDGDTRREH